MPKVTIGMPIYKYVTAETFASILNLRIPPGTEFALEVGSLVYDARNRIAMKAFENGSDYILWLDADMTFPSDTLVRLLEDMEDGKEYVAALMFTRGVPVKPLIIEKLIYEEKDGEIEHDAIMYNNYPEDSLFPVAGSGFGCVMTSTSLLKMIAQKFTVSPFTPIPFLGEDYSLNWRASQLGVPMFCDSRIKCGHVGTLVYDEGLYKAQQKG